jgi:signal transduction histidine kinase
MRSHPDAAPAAPHPEAAAVERLRRVWVAWPHLCVYTVLAFGTAIAVVDRPAAAAPGGVLLPNVAAVALWMHFWIARLRAPHAARGTGSTVALGVLGVGLVAALVLQNASFVVIAIPTLASCFIVLPIGWSAGCAVVMGTAVDVVTRRTGAESHADGVLLATAAVRTLAMIGLGVLIKTIATQSEERRRLLETLAAAERRAGVLEERQRLAREIHDTLAQGFAGIVVHLEAADLAVHRPAGELRANLRFALDVARDSLVEARRMMAELRPELLEDHALAAAVDRVCAEWSQRTGIPSRVAVTGTVCALDREIEVTLLRATQEALNNVRKHAEAGAVAVTLSYMDDVVAVDIGDDGRGLAAGAPEGFGLRAMRERVERLGGAVVIESAGRHGTTLNVSLPLAAAAAAAPR